MWAYLMFLHSHLSSDSLHFSVFTRRRDNPQITTDPNTTVILLFTPFYSCCSFLAVGGLLSGLLVRTCDVETLRAQMHGHSTDSE